MTHKVFISSTIDDLIDVRKDVFKEIESMEVFQPVMVENLAASEESSRRVCFQAIEQVDAVVLILKGRYGFVPEANNPGRLSVTHMEYREAKQMNKPVFAFLHANVEPEPLLAAFINEVSDFDEGVFRKKWGTVEDLRDAVRRALLFWLAKQARRNRSSEASEQAAVQLQREPDIGRIPMYYDRVSFEKHITNNWLQIFMTELQAECDRRILPIPYLLGEQSLENAQNSLSLHCRTSSRAGRLELQVVVTDRNQNPPFPIALEFDSATTEEGARFSALLSVAFMFLLVDDWSAAIDQLLSVSGHRSASNRSRSHLLAIAARISASNQGRRCDEIITRMVQLTNLYPWVVGAGLMAIISAEVRLRYVKATRALAEVEALALRLLTAALNYDPGSAEHFYNLARQSLGRNANAALLFYRQLLQADSSYEERWYFHRDLGLIYYDRGDYKFAAECYDHACQLKDNDSELFRFAGDAYYYQGFWAESQLRYQRALAIEPIESYFLDYKIRFCQSRIRKGKDRDIGFVHKWKVNNWFSKFVARAAESGWQSLAQPLFRMLKSLCDLSFDPNRWLALYANRKGHYAEAASYLESALSVSPEILSVRLNLVMNMLFQNHNQFDDYARQNAKVAIFHGGPETLHRFQLQLTNTKNKDELFEQFSKIFEEVRAERDEWIKRRGEVLKPEKFGGIIHLEIRQ
ncbi:MAG: DUF4062 domain-containing protein [Thermodesulfobacteriota bacterium]